MSSTTNPYQVLGLNERSKPTLKRIHDTYHTLAREHHPDKNLLTSEEATSKFQAIQSAYASLLTEFTLHGPTGKSEDGNSSDKDAKLAKPWAHKKGRKFNHRAMSEVENLRKNAAKAAAQRALDAVLGQEAGERPKEKMRAREWDRERRMEQNAAMRLRAEKAKVEIGQVVKEANRQKRERPAERQMGTSLVHVNKDEDWKKAVTVAGKGQYLLSSKMRRRHVLKQY